MGREGKLERLAEFGESQLLHDLEECAIRCLACNLCACNFNLFSWIFQIPCIRVGGPHVEMAEYRNCSQSFLRGLVLNSFKEEIQKGTNPQLLLSQQNFP